MTTTQTQATTIRPATTTVRRMFTPAALALPLLVVAACNRSIKQPPPLEIDESAVTIFEEGEALWGVRDVFRSGEVVWVLSGTAPFLRSYGLDGSLLAEFGEAGEGPGELLDPRALSGTTPDGTVTVWDPSSKGRPVFSPEGELLSSQPVPVTPWRVRSDIGSVSFGNPYRLSEGDADVVVAHYPEGPNRSDQFWNGGIVRVTPDAAEPELVLDFVADLPGAANRPDGPMSLTPVPLWDRCPDGRIAVLDPYDRSIHLVVSADSSEVFSVPWETRPLRREEHLGYLREVIRVEAQGQDIGEAELDAFATRALQGGGDYLAQETPLGVDLRCTADRVWVQEFEGESHHLGYGRRWRLMTLYRSRTFLQDMRMPRPGYRWRDEVGQGSPYFLTATFPAGFAPYHMTDSLVVGIVGDAMGLQRVALVEL